MVEVRWPEMELLCANRVELEVRVEGRELDGPNMHHKVGQSSARQANGSRVREGRKRLTPKKQCKYFQV